MEVDHDLCTGYAECQRTAGSLFEMNDANQSIPTPAATEADPDLLVRAAKQCPMSAISVADENGTVLF